MSLISQELTSIFRKPLIVSNLIIWYAVVCILIIVLEIAVMVLVWQPINNKEVKDEINAKVRKAMQDMPEDEMQRHFLDLLQVKLECCGIDGPYDYMGDEMESIPRSCMGSAGYLHQQGCSNAVIKYFKTYAGILGGVVVAASVTQLAVLLFALCGIFTFLVTDEIDLEDAYRDDFKDFQYSAADSNV